MLKKTRNTKSKEPWATKAINQMADTVQILPHRIVKIVTFISIYYAVKCAKNISISIHCSISSTNFFMARRPLLFTDMHNCSQYRNLRPIPLLYFIICVLPFTLIEIYLSFSDNNITFLYILSPIYIAIHWLSCPRLKRFNRSSYRHDIEFTFRCNQTLLI